MPIFYYILLIVILSYSLYFVITGLFAFKNSKEKIPSFKPKTHFAILVPCRNEEKVLKSLLESLKKQKYPQRLYDIYVIPNNCTDNTKKIALDSGVNVLCFKRKVSSKGDALKYAFAKLKKNQNIDAYLIFDADNVVHPLFLKKMNDILGSGYKVAQGNRDSKNAQDNWLSGSYSCFYWIQNFFFNKSRMNMNASASINGTGFMVKKEIIDKYGFNVQTLTEDVEFSAQCAINNLKIAYVEDAITYDEQPTKMHVSWKQRKRWTKGNYQCLKTYYKELLKGFWVNKNIACLDMLLNFLAPLIQIGGFILVLLLLLFRLLDIRLYDPFSYLLAHGIFFFLFTFLLSLFISMYVVDYNDKAIKDLWSGLLFFGFFMISWIPINIICLFKKQVNWEQIRHNRNINLSEIIK